MPVTTTLRAPVPASGRGRGAFFLPLTAVLLLSAVLLLAACARPAPNLPMPVSFLPAPGEFLTDTGDALTPDGLRQRAASAAYILVGESHGNACDHLAEARILTLLAHPAATTAQPGAPRIAVGLEMAPAALNPVLDEFRQGAFPPEELEKRLDWKTNWGHPFAKYLPVFRAVGEWKLPTFGLNVPPGVIRRLSAAAMHNATAADPLASLPAEDRAALPARIIEPAPEQLAFLRAILDGHSSRTKGKAAGGGDSKDAETMRARQESRFLLIQSVWDSAMAEQAVNARTATGLPVVVLAGAAHVEGGLGIARRIRVLDPGAEVLLISPWRGDAFNKTDADLRVFCPDSFESRMGMTLVARPLVLAGQGEQDDQVVVSAVARGSRAEAAGLRPGDVVTRAGGYRMGSLAVLHMAGSDAFREKKNMVFVIRRGDACFSVDLGPLGQGKERK
ncbi:MAG: ChaN family lipoprotein [Proteobacteria bacterium]|nr:ChaN family lipoprotein [Pseudomonadota bacterium]